MLPKTCGKLLYNAVRETLETMAFADVVPCSIKVAGEEVAQDDDFAVGDEPVAAAAGGGWGDEDSSARENPADAWGTASPAADESTPADAPVSDSWGDSPEPVTAPAGKADGNFGTPAAENADDAWGTPAADNTDDAWGKSGVVVPPLDPWGGAALAEQATAAHSRPREADFDAMIEEQTDWCWACMNVNSPDVHSVWFVVSKSLANALAQNMYADEVTDMDTPIIRDLIAELTNVLGGRLMLLLEKMGGEFTLTVPEIGFGLPEIPESSKLPNVVCKIVVDGEYPVMVALCFNVGSVLKK